MKLRFPGALELSPLPSFLPGPAFYHPHPSLSASSLLLPSHRDRHFCFCLAQGTSFLAELNKCRQTGHFSSKPDHVAIFRESQRVRHSLPDSQASFRATWRYLSSSSQGSFAITGIPVTSPPASEKTTMSKPLSGSFLPSQCSSLPSDAFHDFPICFFNDH